MSVVARSFVVAAALSFDWFPNVRRPGQVDAGDVCNHLLPMVG